ncbi:hypothetical protein [Acaricomes phytoseiuli]|uniref:hypothetical protein n=1 Tax=Acaricomes phytoseiuli TaxID=291968 RepID=UPI00036EDC05|nr:hypothetical protein [Acaricomes phytoseiuli]
MSETIRDAVMATMNDKIQAGEQLEKAIRHEAEVSALLVEAQQASSKARKAALKAGWSEREMRQLGLLDSSRKPAVRKKKVQPDTASETPGE